MSINLHPAVPPKPAITAAPARPDLRLARPLRPPERLFIEETLIRLYPRLQRHDLFPWALFNGPLIPDFLVKHTPPDLRRIVEIGCGDGVLSNTLSLLFPHIEVIGIDPDPAAIARARATIGNRKNLKFVRGSAANMVEIPCDRIIYNRCLSQAPSSAAYRKLIVKTSSWLVAEGDFIVKEAPLSLLARPALLREFLPRFRQKKGLEACIRSLLGEIGYPNPIVSTVNRLPGIPNEVFYHCSQNVVLTGMLSPAAAQASGTVSEWQDLGDQSTDSVVGYLFSNREADFRHALR